MSEEHIEIENYNYCQNLSREKLEAIVNSMIAPVIHEKDLFLNSKPTPSNLEKRLRFWVNWLANLSENLSGTTSVLDFQYPNIKKQNLEHACRELSQEQMSTCNSIIRQYNEDHARITAQYKQHDSAVLDYQWQKRIEIETKYETIINDLLVGTEIHDASYDFCDVTVKDWTRLSRSARESILQTIYDKKSAILDFEKPQNDTQTLDIESSPIFLAYDDAYVCAHDQLKALIGSDNAHTALGDIPNETFNLMNSIFALQNCFDQLRMELIFIINGELTNSIKVLTARSRGDRKDSAPLKDLKNVIGLVYRALRCSNATSDKAVSVINNVLADQNLRRQMTKAAIVKRAPGNLSDLHPSSLIHRELPVIDGQDLRRFVDESFDECLYRHAEKWLMPYIKNYFEQFKN